MMPTRPSLESADTNRAVAASTGVETPASPNILRASTLRVGMKLTKGLYDGTTGVLLLASGTTITQEFLALLRERDIRYLSTSPHTSTTAPSEPEPEPPTVVPTTFVRAAELDAQVGSLQQDDLQLPIRPLTAQQRPRLALNILEERAARGLKSNVQAEKAVEQFCRAIRFDEKPRSEGLHKVVNEFVDMVSLDLDLMPTIINLQSAGDEYLFQHSINVAAISMNIAMQLGLRREKIMEIGLAGLLSDVGMLRIPESIRLAPRPLSREEMEEVRRHPLYTLDYLERIAGLPREVKFVGLQVHERLDKTGYPRRRDGMCIHAYAKIVAIADAYSAMTKPRPYRAALSPHDAVKCILFDCSAGKYDPAFVRALIDGLSVFPIGSHVELDDGHLARVIRANTGKNTRPVVRVIDPHGRDSGDVVDLAATDEVRIVRVIREIEVEAR